MRTCNLFCNGENLLPTYERRSVEMSLLQKNLNTLRSSTKSFKPKKFCLYLKCEYLRVQHTARVSMRMCHS